MSKRKAKAGTDITTETNPANKTGGQLGNAGGGRPSNVGRERAKWLLESAESVAALMAILHDPTNRNYGTVFRTLYVHAYGMPKQEIDISKRAEVKYILELPPLDMTGTTVQNALGSSDQETRLTYPVPNVLHSGEAIETEYRALDALVDSVVVEPSSQGFDPEAPATGPVTHQPEQETD